MRRPLTDIDLYLYQVTNPHLGHELRCFKPFLPFDPGNSPSPSLFLPTSIVPRTSTLPRLLGPFLIPTHPLRFPMDLVATSVPSLLSLK